VTRSANEVRNQSIVTQFYMFFLVFGSWFAAIARSNVHEDWKMLDLAEVGNGVWDDGFGKDGLRPFELATIRLQRLS